MCTSLIASGYCLVEEPYTIVHFKCALMFLLSPYKKGFLYLQLKFVSQANSGTPNSGMYKLLIATISSHRF